MFPGRLEAVSRKIDCVDEMLWRLRETFESAADGYDAARPSYAEQLFDDLVELAALGPCARLLEIGCATGKATRPLLERGFSVVCVELGVRLAERARANFAGMPIEAHVAPFEVWENERDHFDLVYAETAWHWIDPVIRYRKAHELLRPAGHLAFWSAQHVFPVGYDPFFAEIQRSTTPSAKAAPESGRPLRPIGVLTM
jgi:SAM-dependent methyltransferase